MIRIRNIFPVLVAFASLVSQSLLASGPFTVNTATDTHAASPATSPRDASGHVSLRSAIEAANAQAGATTILLPPGTYNLTLGELDMAPGGGETNTILATGSALNTIVNQTDGSNRVFNLDASSAGGAAVGLIGITIQGGHDRADLLGGAGILAGGLTNQPLDTLTLADCIIANNSCTPPNTNYTAQPGGGVQMAGGNLNVTGCLFSNNVSAASPGGAIAFIASTMVGGGSGGTLEIDTSVFVNNGLTNTSASGPDGAGAIYINSTSNAVHSLSDSTFSGNSVIGLYTGNVVGGAIDLNTGTLNVDSTSFTSNSVSGALQEGGAIYVDSGTLNVSFSRFEGNTAPGGGSAIFNHTSNGAATSAENNWWASNAGPGPAVSGASVAAWLELNLFASPNPVLINNIAVLDATFEINSVGDVIAPANLSLLVGMPVTFGNAVGGIISGAQTTIQSSGTATALFTAGNVVGPGSAGATVDGATATTPIDIVATNLSVLNTNDSGPGSLRQAITDIYPGGTITFDPGLAGRTIYLTSGELLLAQNLNINGPGANLLTVSGNQLSRVFDIPPGVIVAISGLSVADGLAGGSVPNPNLGGGIYNAGALTLMNCAVYGNSAPNSGLGWGGGIYSTNILNLTGCTVGPTNEAGEVGGGIYVHFGSQLQMLNCTVASNSSPFQVGGIAANTGATVSLTNCTITGNSDAAYGGGYGGQPPQLKNTIIAGNSDSGSAVIDDLQTFNGAVLSLGHNLIGITNSTTGWLTSDLTGSTSSPLNARLGPLANNGGPTLTCALLTGSNSPAINAGDNSDAPPFDQRGPGFPRIVGGTIDIGAYELIPPTLNIAHLPAQVILSWPTNAVGYVLESAPALNPPVTWTPAGAPGIVGSQYYVTNGITPGGKQFFRLDAH